LGYDGKGWWWQKPLIACGIIKSSWFTVFAETVTRFSESKNCSVKKFFSGVCLLNGGVIHFNSSRSKGIEWWAKAVGPYVSRENNPLVLSVFAQDIKEMEYIAKMVDRFDLAGVEINVSYSNIKNYHRLEASQFIKDDALSNSQSRK